VRIGLSIPYGAGLRDSRNARNNHFSAVASDQPTLEACHRPFLNDSVSSSRVHRSGPFPKVVFTCIKCVLDSLKPRVSLTRPLLTDIARVNTLGSLGSAPISDRLGVALRLWGMPIGEFFDLEALSQFCAGSKRYSFFFSSWPLNMYVISPARHSVLFIGHACYSFLKSRRGRQSSERIGESGLGLC
jgi:hypothetical protein